MHGWPRHRRIFAPTLFLLACTCLNSGRVSAETFAYATDFSGGQVVVVDTDSRALVAIIPVAATPLYVAASPTEPRVYVTHRDPGLLSVLDTTTNSVLTEIAVGPMLRGVDVSPDGETIYVVSEAAREVFLVDAASHQIAGSIRVNVSPGQIAVRPDGLEAWVTRQDGSGIDILDLRRRRMVDRIQTGLTPRPIQFTGDSRTAYVGFSAFSRSISAFDVRSRTVRSTIPMDGFMQALALDPSEELLYAGQSIPSGFLTIDLSTETVISTLNTMGNPLGIAITLQGPTAFAAQLNEDEILAVDLSTLSLLQAIKIPDSTFHIDLASSSYNSLPEIDCGESVTVVADPGSCSAPVLCDQVALCADPDGDLVHQLCAQAEATAPASEITVICRDDFSTASRDCPVTVLDQDRPEIEVTLQPSVLWPPDHRLVEVEAVVTATDGCGPADFRLVSISSSDREDALGDGNTAMDVVDAQPGTADTSFSLRAEWSQGRTRAYTIIYEATDASGNTRQASSTVEVRRN